jgi:hypothetical protein
LARKRTEWQELTLKVVEAGPHGALTDQQLRAYLNKRWADIHAPKSLNVGRVIRFLLGNTAIERVEIAPDPSAKNTSGQLYRSKPRYVWPDTTSMSVALSLRSNSYFTHATAVFLLGLSQELPGTIYVNCEQSPKPSPVLTSQAAIDQAFKGHPRVSKYAYSFRDNRIVLLSGKHTGKLEVSEIKYINGEFYPVTKVERTLIDCVVRPTYAGGIFHVRDIFTNAKDRVSANVLVATLKKLAYVYPYHQAIGFVMERAGYPSSQFERLRELGLQYDFYLTHRMNETEYDPSWRIHYPKGF